MLEEGLTDGATIREAFLAAERWLRDLTDLAEGWQEGEGLPAPEWMVVGALRKALKPENDRDQNGMPSIRVQTRSGRRAS